MDLSEIFVAGRGSGSDRYLSGYMLQTEIERSEACDIGINLLEFLINQERGADLIRAGQSST